MFNQLNCLSFYPTNTTTYCQLLNLTCVQTAHVWLVCGILNKSYLSSAALVYVMLCFLLTNCVIHIFYPLNKSQNLFIYVTAVNQKWCLRLNVYIQRFFHQVVACNSTITYVLIFRGHTIIYTDMNTF